MTALDALTTITLLAIVPALVWWLGRTGWTGDRKRVVVIAAALLLGVVQAILTGVIAVTPGVLAIIERAVITVAGVLVLSQSAYTLLWSKLPDSDAEPEATVLPARAGMIPVQHHPAPEPGGAPRASGDDPPWLGGHEDNGRCSPRERG